MTRQARAVVIGGGIMGVSVAYHLAANGWTDVILCEKGELTSGSTWHAAGQITHAVGSRTLGWVNNYSMELYQRLEKETGQGVGWHGCCALRVSYDDDEIDWLKSIMNVGRVLDLPMELVGPDGVRETNPHYNVDGARATSAGSSQLEPGKGHAMNAEHPIDCTVHLGTIKRVTACGRRQTGCPESNTAVRWDRVTCQSCLRTTLPFYKLVLYPSFDNLEAMPNRLRDEALRDRWERALAWGEGNEMTRILAFKRNMNMHKDEEKHGSECDLRRDVRRVVEPNIFDYATGELFQDAVICWLIRWSAVENAETIEDKVHRRIGRSFIDAMLAKHGRSLKGDIVCAELYQQDCGIDVLARIREQNGTEHVLLIEDKTDAGVHGDQLHRYLEAVRERCWPIYLKTGNYSLGDAREIEGGTDSEGRPGYKAFDRRDFLGVLSGYTGDHAIVTKFRAYLQKIEDRSDSWRDWNREGRRNWSWEAWQGFYRSLEERFARLGEPRAPGKMGWGDVSNPRGGFLGFWWFPFGWNDSPAYYLQLEVVPEDPSRQKLCFKVAAGEPGRTAQDYYRLMSEAA